MRRIVRIAAAAALAALAASSGAHAQAVVWSRAWNGPSGASATLGDGYIIGRSLAADNSGNLLAAGASGSGDAADFLTTKVDGATGRIAWQQSFAGSAGKEDDAMSVAVDASGNAIVAGLTFDASGDIAIEVVKYGASDGVALWQVKLGGGTYNTPFVVATDAAGNAIVGAETNASGTSDLRVVKLAAATGATAWDKTIDGGHDDYMSDLVVDSAGNVVVAGIGVNAAGNDDWTIVKLAAANGAQAWKKTYDGGSADDAFSVALDAAGNVFVTGSTKGASDDVLTMKLGAADGAIAWQKTFDGGKEDSGQAVMVDAQGNAVVAAQTRNAAGNFDFLAIKYAAADGAVAWKKTWDGGADDWAYNLALDAAGNAYVTGSTTVNGGTDWMTIGFAAANGATILQSSYKGGAAQADDAYEIVATKDGIVVGGIASENGAAPGVRLMKLALPGASAGGSGGTGDSGSTGGSGGAASTDVALASAGATASASSSQSTRYPASAVIDGDRTGAGYGNGGVWADGTPYAFPDWVQVNFAAPRTIDHVVVYSMQDSYSHPVEPTGTTTFRSYGVSDFSVQAWNGSAWTTLGTVTGNNLVKRTVTFAPVTTDRIRVTVSKGLNGASRIAEIEAWTSGGSATGTPTPIPTPTPTPTPTPSPGTETNVAAASAGGIASASSTLSTRYPVAAINDGVRSGPNFGNGGVWSDATAYTFPDWVQVRFASTKTVDRVVVYSMQDRYTQPVDPGDTLTFNAYGVVAFQVQAWNGSGWTTLASVAGNNLVKRTVSFAPVATDRIRIVIDDARNGYSRLAEVEAWGG
jgi:hypothetical protein